MIGVSAGRDGALIDLRVVPRASRNEIKFMDDGAIRVRLQAPPVDGKANAALLKFFADRFGIPARDVVLVSGESARRKRILLTGLTVRQVEDRLL